MIRFLKTWYAIPLAVIVISCGAKRKAMSREQTAAKNLPLEKIRVLSQEKLLKFNTLSGAMNVNYISGSNSQEFTINYRIKKDSIIWLNATLGLVRVHITPHTLKFYNKLNQTYYEGNYSEISKWLGIDGVGFGMLQDILVGKLSKMDESVEVLELENRYLLACTNPSKTMAYDASVDPSDFKLISQSFKSVSMGLTLKALYVHQPVNNSLFPSKINISIGNESSADKIEIEYKQIEVDKVDSFPYNLPKGYKRIEFP